MDNLYWRFCEKPMPRGVVVCAAGCPVGSGHVFDALMMARGPYLATVLADGQERGGMVYADGFIVRSCVDATAELYTLARLVALSVAHVWQPTEIVSRWLSKGEGREAAEVEAFEAATATSDEAVWAAAKSAALSASVDPVEAARQAIVNAVRAHSSSEPEDRRAQAEIRAEENLRALCHQLIACNPSILGRHGRLV